MACFRPPIYDREERRDNYKIEKVTEIIEGAIHLANKYTLYEKKKRFRYLSHINRLSQKYKYGRETESKIFSLIGEIKRKI